MGNNEYAEAHADREKEITTFIMLHRITVCVTRLDERMIAIEEALKSVCGSVEALSTGLKALSDEQNRHLCEVPVPDGDLDTYCRKGGVL
jgi:hypothetical protein